MLLSLSFQFLLIYWYTRKIKFIEVLLERHRELAHESTKYAYVDTFTMYRHPSQMYAVSWCFCKLLCCSHERYSLSSLSQDFVFLLISSAYLSVGVILPTPSLPWLCCVQWLGWNKFCESHRVQVVYTFFLTSVVALKGAVLIPYIFSFLFIFLCDHISAIWNDARRSGFWSVGIQYAHGWDVVHSKSINKDEDKDKNIFCFTNNISPKFNDLFIG